ncbi:PD-(D/E)XK motif protein [Pseudomonas fluorescens]|uniref:PD-(D/E)XK motif protein n=1 Tax=Pseudomonas fluorescens TaxID=294 RepID=UPI002ACA3D0E|nr:PD-(D/E)XK motif protein [Pseudomonas fluorescens]MDZ5435399.1 PD-(D/E)XK motif protein [Pseudomonas fluorescens]
MSIKIMTAEESWKTLRTGAFDADIFDIPTVPSSVETAYGPARYALGKDGEARVLLPINIQERLPKLPQTPALKHSELTIRSNGKLLRFLDIACRIVKLEKVFAEVVDEIFNRINAGTKSSEAYSSTLKDFRNLLVNPHIESAKYEVVLGLLGELILLEHLLKKNSEAWESWRGPLLDRHDFRSEKNAIEVKVSGRKSINNVNISSLEQLMEPEGGLLYLYHLVLEETNIGINVSSQVQKIYDLSSSASDIRTRLENIGCIDPEAEAWNKHSFNIESITLYQVNRNFPRLTLETFDDNRPPPGVNNIQYAIDLDFARNCTVAPSDIDNILSSFAQ